ncbi:MAG: hypothetical protein IIX68_04630, partial [Clostridia bacterium]|nr:hypothetical protein [Clostridia bacterium]
MGLRNIVVLQTIPPEDSIHQSSTAAADVADVIVFEIIIRVALLQRKTRLAPNPRVADQTPTSKHAVQSGNHL